MWALLQDKSCCFLPDLAVLSQSKCSNLPQTIESEKKPTNLLYQHRERARAQELSNLTIGHFFKKAHLRWSWWMWGWTVNMAGDGLFQGLCFPSKRTLSSLERLRDRLKNQLVFEVLQASWFVSWTEPAWWSRSDDLCLLMSQSQSHPGRLAAYFPVNRMVQSSLSPISLA